MRRRCPHRAVGEGILRQAHPDVATPHKAAIVVRPVTDTIAPPGDPMTPGLMRRERQAGTRTRCKGPAHARDALSIYQRLGQRADRFELVSRR